jgi:predicted CXXCH cytochrome family protein
VAAANSGVSTLTADSCAGCHRAHTAQARYLLAEEEEDLCLSCHGSQGVGATTDVELGIQYKVALAPGSAGQGTANTVIAGALRGGGFVQARINSSDPTRVSYPRLSNGSPVASFSSLVPVAAAGAPVTSAHMKFADATGVVSQGRVWGNGPLGTAGAGAAPVSLSCGSCHNPHGNGQYRILNPVPAPVSETGTTPAFVPAGTGVVVTDAPATNETRNYTVKQTPGGTASLLLSQVSGSPATDGDYWRRYVPWNGVPTWDAGTGTVIPATGTSGDRPNGLNTWERQVSRWCAACHTRYDAPTGSWGVDSGDDIYMYRHGIYRTGATETASTECTQCHVSHGSNALMPGSFSNAYPYPHTPGTTAVTSASSRLLKVDNRGTCQQCHDPTGTIGYDGVVTNP